MLFLLLIIVIWLVMALVTSIIVLLFDESVDYNDTDDCLLVLTIALIDWPIILFFLFFVMLFVPLFKNVVAFIRGFIDELKK